MVARNVVARKVVVRKMVAKKVVARKVVARKVGIRKTKVTTGRKEEERLELKLTNGGIFQALMLIVIRGKP